MNQNIQGSFLVGYGQFNPATNSANTWISLVSSCLCLQMKIKAGICLPKKNTFKFVNMDVCLLLIPVKWMEESVHKVRVRYLVGETKQSLEKSPNVSFAFFGHLEKIL